MRVSAGEGGGQSVDLTFIVSSTANQAAVAPASAWLERISDREQQSKFVMDCIGCHQVPSPEVRDYAALIADLNAPDPHQARLQSWNAIVKYMNYLTAWEFARGNSESAGEIDAEAAYSVSDGEEVAALMAEIFDERMDSITGYDWGAPLITTDETTIWEYEIPHPNAIREALMLGDPGKLWVADVSTNRMYAVDIASGNQEVHEIPADVPMGPHSLHRGQDGSLWVAPFFNGIVAHLDPAR